MTTVTGKGIVFTGLQQQRAPSRFYFPFSELEFRQKRVDGLNVLPFAEAEFVEDWMDRIWVMESDEETKQRLVVGLQKVGITCQESDIYILWKDEENGTKRVHCMNCRYAPCTPNAFFAEYGWVEVLVPGLAEHDFARDSPLGFLVTKQKEPLFRF